MPFVGHWLVRLDSQPCRLWFELLLRKLLGLPHARALQHNQPCNLSGKVGSTNVTVKNNSSHKLGISITAAAEPQRDQVRPRREEAKGPPTLLCSYWSCPPDHAVHRGVWKPRSPQPTHQAKEDVGTREKEWQKRCAQSCQLWKHVGTELWVSINCDDWKTYFFQANSVSKWPR